MNYKELYDQLIIFRKLNKLVKSKEESGKIETHHILPRCCGGSDDLENLVNLYAKEHFMAHYYLWKMHENDEFKHQMLNAFWMMCTKNLSLHEYSYQEYIKMSKEYQEARIQFAKQCSVIIPNKIKGSKNGKFGTHWYYDPLTNESHQYVDGQQPVGWILGRKYKDRDAFVKAVSKANKGRVWIMKVDGSIQKFIDKEIAKILVKTGLWKYGHTQKLMSNEAKLRIKNAHLDIKHQQWLKETQDMADYYVLYGYEATCKKFNVSMSCESMLMRFIRARNKYGIKFESMRSSGRKRVFNKVM